VDCRAPLGYDREEVRALIERVLAGSEYEFEFLDPSEPTWSLTNTALYQCITGSLLSYVPNAEVTPYMATGGTDSRFFRQFGVVAYGFQPFKVEGSYSD